MVPSDRERNSREEGRSADEKHSPVCPSFQLCADWFSGEMLSCLGEAASVGTEHEVGWSVMRDDGCFFSILFSGMM